MAILHNVSTILNLSNLEQEDMPMNLTKTICNKFFKVEFCVLCRYRNKNLIQTDEKTSKDKKK